MRAYEQGEPLVGHSSVTVSGSFNRLADEMKRLGRRRIMIVTDPVSLFLGTDMVPVADSLGFPHPQ